MLLLDGVLEVGQAVVPERVQPAPELAGRLWSGSVQAASAERANVDQPGVLQDRQVLGDRRPRDLEPGGDLAGRQFPIANKTEDLPPGGGRKGVKDLVHDGNVSTT